MCLCAVDVLRKPAVVVGQGSGHLSVRDETRFHGVRLPGSRLLDAARQSLRHAILQAGLSVAPAPTFQVSCVCDVGAVSQRISRDTSVSEFVIAFINFIIFISKFAEIHL